MLLGVPSPPLVISVHLIFSSGLGDSGGDQEGTLSHPVYRRYQEWDAVKVVAVPDLGGSARLPQVGLDNP